MTPSFTPLIQAQLLEVTNYSVSVQANPPQTPGQPQLGFRMAVAVVCANRWITMNINSQDEFQAVLALLNLPGRTFFEVNTQTLVKQQL